MSSTDPFDDPVPHTIVLSLDDAFRVLEAIEDARLEVAPESRTPMTEELFERIVQHS